MRRFDSILEEYKMMLSEQPAPPPGGDPGGAPPPPPPGGDPGGGMPPGGGGEGMPPEEPNPEDVVNELEKASKKPWGDLASILARAIDFNFSEQDKQRINSELPGGLTLEDFIDITLSPGESENASIRNKHDPNIVSAAITLFDTIVPNILGGNRQQEFVPPAEEI